jgi:hypothetical protein
MDQTRFACDRRIVARGRHITLTEQRLRAKHHHKDPRSRRQVTDIKSESRPASNRNRWPASYWKAWPASSESAICYRPLARRHADRLSPGDLPPVAFPGSGPAAVSLPAHAIRPMADRAPGSVLTPRAGRPESAASLDPARRDVSPVALHPTCGGWSCPSRPGPPSAYGCALARPGCGRTGMRRKAQPSLDTDSH